MQNLFNIKNGRLCWLCFCLFIAGLSNAQSQPNITRVEYYIDTDPGYGNATAASISPAKQLNAQITINTGNLAAGLHVMGLRSRDANNTWSLDERWLFYKATTSVAPLPIIKKVEYYVDTDPGYGKAKSISLTASTNIQNDNFKVSIDTLKQGLHVLAVRSQDANNVWSLDERWLFYKPAFPTPLPNIKKIEYYIDADPGYNKANDLKITASTDVSKEFNVSVDTLKPGLHVLAVRSQDANNAWSLDERWLIVKGIAADTIPYINAIEYYIDKDPGYGKAIPLAIKPKVNDIANLNSFVNISSLPTGLHTAFIRTKDANGAWSLDEPYIFTIATAVPAPVIVVNSIAFEQVCKGGYFNIGVHSTGKYNAGNQFIVELSDAAGSFTSPKQIGSKKDTASGLVSCTLPVSLSESSSYKIRVRSTNPAVTGEVSKQGITLNRYALGNDTFAIVVCGDATADITKLYNPKDATLTWSIANPTSAPLGIYKVFATNALGCMDTALVAVKQDIAYWKGTVNNNWHNAANWSTGKVPTDSTHVIIETDTPNSCYISTADAEAASVHVMDDKGLRIITNRKLIIKAACKTLPGNNK